MQEVHCSVIDVCVLVTQSCLTLCDSIDCGPPVSSVHGIFPGKNTGVDCHSLLQGIFLTQRWNWHVLRLACIGRWVLYNLLHMGSPT